MKRPAATGVGVALLGGAAAVAGSFLATGGSDAFVGAALSAIVTDVTPAVIVSTSITELGDMAAMLVVLTALSAGVVLYAAIAVGAMAVWYKPWQRYRAGAVAAGGGWFLTTLLTGDPVGALGAGVPLGLVVILGTVAREPGRATFDPDRRHVGKLATAVAGFGAISYLASGNRRTDPSPLDFSEEDRETIQSKLATAREQSLDVATPSGLVSEIGDFYEVDINPTVNPSVGEDVWTLRMIGEVENEHILDYDTLLEQEPVHRFHTLRCVGERLNDHKMDTALWTGISMDRIVDEVGPTSGCNCVVVRAEDGYFEEFPIEALRRGMLVYGMNGERLPRAHGAPVRLVVPGHWGEISVKWVTIVEFLQREMDGYWEQRGWHGTGPVKTVAKLHAVEHLDDGRVRIGGHAYAGYRGISAVEVSTTGGDSWVEATLSEPLPDEATWRQWQHVVELEGPTELVVRAIEADGTVQPSDETGPFPQGPSGWVTRQINPE